jgi:HEPN domain-containing protein
MTTPPAKPENCTCAYPTVVARNMSGHDEGCPVYVEWERGVNGGRAPCPYVKEYGTESAHCELAETGIKVFERKFKDAERLANDWRHEFNMYRTAWIRELGGKLIPKTHDIDALVLTTKALREKAERAARLKELVEDRGFFAVLQELKELSEGVGDGLLSFYLKTAADVAKNMEHASGAKAVGPTS